MNQKFANSKNLTIRIYYIFAIKTGPTVVTCFDQTIGQFYIWWSTSLVGLRHLIASYKSSGLETLASLNAPTISTCFLCYTLSKIKH